MEYRILIYLNFQYLLNILIHRNSLGIIVETQAWTKMGYYLAKQLKTLSPHIIFGKIPANPCVTMYINAKGIKCAIIRYCKLLLLHSILFHFANDKILRFFICTNLTKKWFSNEDQSFHFCVLRFNFLQIMHGFKVMVSFFRLDRAK